MRDNLLLGILQKALEMLTAMETILEEEGMVIIPMGEATIVHKDMNKRPSHKFLL